MKQLKHTLTLFVALWSISVFAQQDPMFTHYMFNPLTVNAGYAGSRDVLSVNALIREQWVGIDGRPRTQTLQLHTPFMKKAIGLGLSFVNDRVGPLGYTGIGADIAYRMRVTAKTRLSFGIKGGVNILSADLTTLKNTDPEDPHFQQNVSGNIVPNAGAGLYFDGSNFYAGFSLPKLLKNKIDIGLNASERFHFFVMGGYAHKINSSLYLKPSALIKVVKGAPIETDLTAMLLINQLFDVGAMYRTGDAVALLLGYFLLPQLKINYAYDFTLSALQNFNSGSHELSLRYEFFYREKQKIKSPRFF